MLKTDNFVCGSSYVRQYCIETDKDIVIFFLALYRPIILNPLQNWKGNILKRGLNWKWGEKNLQFLASISLHLGIGTKQGRSYYGTLIGRHMISIKPVHFPWPSWRWVPLKGHFSTKKTLESNYIKILHVLSTKPIVVISFVGNKCCIFRGISLWLIVEFTNYKLQRSLELLLLLIRSNESTFQSHLWWRGDVSC